LILASERDILNKFILSLEKSTGHRIAQPNMIDDCFFGGQCKSCDVILKIASYSYGVFINNSSVGYVYKNKEGLLKANLYDDTKLYLCKRLATIW
jgi:hypothetical protein